MQPFDPPAEDLPGTDRDYDDRRLRYLESIIHRATLNATPRDPDIHPTLCDAVTALGLNALAPGLAAAVERLDAMEPRERDELQRARLLDDRRETALARALLVRADPLRQDELFGWERLGINPEEYWARLAPTPHMLYLLETADFGANEVLRLVYLLDAIPEHLAEDAPLWRDATAMDRDPNFPEATSEAVRKSFLAFKYWWDDPFRCNEFSGEPLAIRSSRERNGHEDMEPGQDMTYWSENHRLLFAAAEYLAGQFWAPEQFMSQPGSRRGGPVLRPGDMTGAEHTAHARRRVLRWLDERLRMGFAEWNAPGYYVEDILPLANLVDFAVEPEIRTKAAMVLDLLAFDIAVHGQSGAFAGSAGRAYFEHKNCVWGQSIRDSAEILFGQLGHFVGPDNGAISLATSPSWRPPAVLGEIAAAAPSVFSTRSRVSIDFAEAPDHGVATSSEDDMEFWWSRAAYVAKQTVSASRHIAQKYGLMESPPFSKILPLMESIAKAIDTGEDVGAGILGGIGGAVAGFAVGGPAGAVAGAAAGAYLGQSIPDYSLEDAADTFSVLTEGSVLSRADIVSHTVDGASLASVQSFRRGQLNFQGVPCIAALPRGAMVWPTCPSAGSRITFSMLFGAIEVDEELFGPNDHDGPNWWTGNVAQPRVAQHGPAAIIAYDIPFLQSNLFGERTHAWFPRNQFDETRGPVAPGRCNHEESRWFFGRVNECYVGLFSARETDWTKGGPWHDRELRAEGDTNVFILQIGSARDFGDFNGFIGRVSSARIHVSGLKTPADLACSYDIPFGERLSLHYEDGPAWGGDTLDRSSARHASPFARIAWGQDRYVIQHAGHALVHDIPAARRVIGGRLDRLEHDTPLTVYAQNMALLPGPLYKGIDSDAALGHLVRILAERRPDIVGLSEMWTSTDRDRVCEALAHHYPHHIEGPHEALVDVGPLEPELMGGGLLLLSRHRITDWHQTVYRQSSGDDGLTSKGAIHARIEPAGQPCPVDMFLTHTQAPEPTIGGSVAEARKAVEAQLVHLGSFIAACRHPAYPAMVMGDFNVDQIHKRDLYDHMIRALRNPMDPVPVEHFGDPGDARAHPEGTSESDHHAFSSFHHDHPVRNPHDGERFGDTIDRLDYILLFPGLLYEHRVSEADVVVEQWESGRDMSDHYGVQVVLDRTVQQLPAHAAGFVATARIRRVQCLQTTGGWGDDEIRMTMELLGGGPRQTQVTTELGNMAAGSVTQLELDPLRVRVRDELVLRLSGKEVDDWTSADDDLGTVRRVLDLDLLAALADAGTQLLSMPVLTGDDGEYVVDVEVAVERA